MLVKSARYYEERGYPSLNLGLAPLAHITPEERSTFTDKTVALIAESIPNLKGLFSFKDKYNPDWEPRYLAYPGVLSLPGATLAVIKAGNPRGVVKKFGARLHL